MRPFGPSPIKGFLVKRFLPVAALLLPLLVSQPAVRAAQKGATSLTPVPARSADAFVDAMGVCTHWGYPDTPYGFAYEQVKKLLGDLGVRHVRDGFHPREEDLFQTYGIRTTVIVGPTQPIGKTVQTLKENVHLVAMVEGPNEVDLFPTSANYNGKGFPEGPRNFQNDLYAALKADPATRRLPVIAPSTARNDSNLRLAPLRAFDHTVMHSYAGGQMPSRSLEGRDVNNVANAYRILGTGADLKPIVVTESGYHTALGSSVVLGGAQPGVSERAQAKYLPRHFCEYWNAGIARTFTYEFIDEFPDYDKSEHEATNAEACFGIVKRDGKPKPAYHALKNLIALLREGTWNPRAKTWDTPRVAPRALSFRLSGDTADVHHTLLQKSDGDFYLILWREVSSFDTAARKDIRNPDAAVTLHLGSPVRSAAVYRPGQGSQALKAVASPSRSIALSVPDELLVVRLTPAKATDAKAPTAPARLTSATTGTTATLRWSPARDDAKVAGYFVTRMGRLVGRTAVPTFADAGLTPGTGYTYSVAAFDAAGNLSPVLSGVVRTREVFPDLAVTDVGWTPAGPKPGDAVTFTATITNRGTAPTSAGTVHGVAFFVDGTFVSWSDTFRDALAPGASRTVTANNGPKGTSAWPLTPGPHTVRAVLDDLNRITESDETNNVREKPLAGVAP
uniref:GH119 n=1 Tax=uncultured Armatimonadetes bacterium TaxID=157466 RepID=A0A6J4I7Z9_9BACT|nr:GH119 [uncultured Armatimonadetes bacterium]